MSRHLADRMRIVVNARGARIARPAVGLGGSTKGEIGSQEGMQAGSRVIGHLLKADTAGTGPAVLHFDRTNDEDFALMTAPPTADERIILAAAGDLGLIDFDKAV